MNWISQHKLLFIATIVIVAGAVWYGLSQGGAAQPLLTTSTPTRSAGGDQELVSTLLALRSVSLSGTIFSDPAFASLHDNGTTIVPEPVGRPNPFAPLQGAAGQSASSTHQAQIFAPQR